MTKKPTIGDKPIEPEFVAQMNVLATVIDEHFNGEAKGHDRKIGFLLMVYHFGDKGRANYISNTNRKDVMELLKDQLARFEKEDRS